MKWQSVLFVVAYPAWQVHDRAEAVTMRLQRLPGTS